MKEVGFLASLRKSEEKDASPKIRERHYKGEERSTKK